MPRESKRSRRQFSIEQKVAILRRHLVDKVPVSELSEEYKLQPSVLYQWQRQVFENLAAALEGMPVYCVTWKMTAPPAGAPAGTRPSAGGAPAGRSSWRPRR